MSLWARMFGKQAGEPEAEVAQPESIPEPPTVEHVAVVREPEPVSKKGSDPLSVEPEPEPVSTKGSDPLSAEPFTPAPEPELAAPEVAPEPRRASAPTGPVTEDELESRLTAVLDSLGSAHRRPFVRNG